MKHNLTDKQIAALKEEYKNSENLQEEFGEVGIYLHYHMAVSAGLVSNNDVKVTQNLWWILWKYRNKVFVLGVLINVISAIIVHLIVWLVKWVK